MSASNPPPRSEIRVRFGAFELLDSELRAAAGRVPLPPQPLRLLQALVARPGRIVSREELRQHLWGDLHVDHEHGLNFAVRQLRVALGDSPTAPRFVETVPKLGYRFVAPVQVVGGEPTPSPRPRVPRRWLASAVALLAAGLAGFGLPSGATSPRVLVRPLPGAPGLSDDLILELARVPRGRLSVLASSSATIGEAGPLRATHVVEGHQGADGIDVRLTARDGQVVWAGRLDSSDFAAARLAREVALALDVPAPSLRPGSDPLLREGWRLLRLGTEEDAERARARFQDVADHAPASAEARIGLAESWRRLPGPASETSPAWRAAAERAVELDRGDARGHLSLAGYRLYRARDLAGSRAAFERALALAPGLAAVHDAYAGWFSAQGRHEEALALARRAAELDPLSTGIQLDLGWYLHLARRHDEAATVLERAFALERVPGCLDHALRARLAGQRWAEARALALRVMEARAADPRAIAAVRGAGSAQEAVQRHLRWNLDRLRARGTSAGTEAIELAWLGEHDEALRLLAQELAGGGGWVLCYLAVEPAWDGLRGRAEFRVLLARTGLSRG